MKLDTHTQLFDLINVGKKHEPETNAFFNNYMCDELKGNAKQKFDELGNEMNTLQKTMLIPKIALQICICIIVVFVATFINSIIELGFTKVYENAPYLLWIFVVFCFITIFVFAYYCSTKKKITLAVIDKADEVNQLNKMIIESFNLPSNLETLYVFERFFKPRKAKFYLRVCIDISAYSDEYNVYLITDAKKLKLPKCDCISTEFVEEKIIYSDSSDIDYKSPEIKQYKIKQNEISYISKSFVRVMFQKGGEIFTIEMPPFSFDLAKKLFKKE